MRPEKKGSLESYALNGALFLAHWIVEFNPPAEMINSGNPEQR